MLLESEAYCSFPTPWPRRNGSNHPMTSTVLVLVIALVCELPLFLIAMVAVAQLAKRNGQKLKLMSWSFRHGFTAEFFDSPKDISADNE